GGIILFPRRKFSLDKKLARKAEPLPMPPSYSEQPYCSPETRDSFGTKFARKAEPLPLPPSMVKTA
ncbi:MAG: hypothetical protein K2J11_04320, partial [Oscillospiraceae bacterium]|nr:hypothetical protein [Oscillospiraceae bacterium]